MSKLQSGIQSNLKLMYCNLLQEISVEGYRLPADYAVVYMTYGAQRDPAVFENPDEFIPERWLNRYEMEVPGLTMLIYVAIMLFQIHAF